MRTNNTQNSAEKADKAAGHIWNHFVQALIEDKPDEIRHELLTKWRSAYARSHALMPSVRH
jgi:hypothetical protein